MSTIETHKKRYERLKEDQEKVDRKNARAKAKRAANKDDTNKKDRAKRAADPEKRGALITKYRVKAATRSPPSDELSNLWCKHIQGSRCSQAQVANCDVADEAGCETYRLGFIVAFGDTIRLHIR